jgi:hypothetical protein
MQHHEFLSLRRSFCALGVERTSSIVTHRRRFRAPEVVASDGFAPSLTSACKAVCWRIARSQTAGAVLMHLSTRQLPSLGRIGDSPYLEDDEEVAGLAQMEL